MWYLHKNDLNLKMIIFEYNKNDKKYLRNVYQWKINQKLNDWINQKLKNI